MDGTFVPVGLLPLDAQRAAHNRPRTAVVARDGSGYPFDYFSPYRLPDRESISTSSLKIVFPAGCP